MATYAVKVGGWMCVLDAATKQDAYRRMRALATSASLLPSDVQEHAVKLATAEDIEWHRSMGGAVRSVSAHDRTVQDAERLVEAHRAIREIASLDGLGISVDSFTMACAAWECFTGAPIEEETFEKALELAFDGSAEPGSEPEWEPGSEPG